MTSNKKHTLSDYHLVRYTYTQTFIRSRNIYHTVMWLYILTPTYTTQCLFQENITLLLSQNSEAFTLNILENLE